MSKIRSEWAVSSVGCFPKHFFFYSLYWKPSYLSTLIHIITVSTRNSEQDLLPRNFLSPALLSSPKMTVCQQYLYCWENSHAAQLRSQHRREYSPTCKLLKSHDCARHEGPHQELFVQVIFPVSVCSPCQARDCFYNRQPPPSGGYLPVSWERLAQMVVLQTGCCPIHLCQPSFLMTELFSVIGGSLFITPFLPCRAETYHG